MQLNRPAYPILDNVYGFLRRAPRSESVKLPFVVRRELSLVARLAILFFQRLDKPLLPFLYMIDASASGGGVVRAKGSIDMHSGSELRAKSRGKTYIDGDFVNLNCRDRTGYHDDPALAGALDAPDQAALSAPTESDDRSGD